MSREKFLVVISISVLILMNFWISLFIIDDSQICSMYEKQIKLIQDPTLEANIGSARIANYTDEKYNKEFSKIVITCGVADLTCVYTESGDIVSIDYNSSTPFVIFMAILLTILCTVIIGAALYPNESKPSKK
ncbi:MAG: hypothetical protein IKV94_03630 [Clostridia bacterium]|nr:hypothetical protein [Clostridia bacterium]